jgi:hypothetical protein
MCSDGLRSHSISKKSWITTTNPAEKQYQKLIIDNRKSLLYMKKIQKFSFFLLIFLFVCFSGCAQQSQTKNNADGTVPAINEIHYTDISTPMIIRQPGITG